MSDETAFHANCLLPKCFNFHILSDCGLRPSGMELCVGEGENSLLNCFQEKNVHIYITILYQFKCWKYCAGA